MATTKGNTDCTTLSKIVTTYISKYGVFEVRDRDSVVLSPRAARHRVSIMRTLAANHPDLNFSVSFGVTSYKGGKCIKSPCIISVDAPAPAIRSRRKKSLKDRPSFWGGGRLGEKPLRQKKKALKFELSLSNSFSSLPVEPDMGDDEFEGFCWDPPPPKPKKKRPRVKPDYNPHLEPKPQKRIQSASPNPFLRRRISDFCSSEEHLPVRRCPRTSFGSYEIDLDEGYIGDSSSSGPETDLEDCIEPEMMRNMGQTSICDEGCKSNFGKTLAFPSDKLMGQPPGYLYDNYIEIQKFSVKVNKHTGMGAPMRFPRDILIKTHGGWGFRATPAANEIRKYAMMKCDVEIRVSINSTFYHTGQICLIPARLGSYNPTGASFEYLRNRYSGALMVSYPMFAIDVNKPGTHEFLIPYAGLAPYMYTRTKFKSMDAMYDFDMIPIVGVDVQAPEGMPADIVVLIEARLRNVDVKGITDPMAVYSTKRPPFLDPPQDPEMFSIFQSIGTTMATAGKIASNIGTTIAGVGNATNQDMPTDVTPPSSMIIGQQPMSYGNGTVRQSQAVTINPVRAGPSVPNQGLTKDLIRKWGRLGVYQMKAKTSNNAGSPAGSVLWHGNITPIGKFEDFGRKQSVTGQGDDYFFTPLAYVAQHAYFWMGGIEYAFQFHKTSMHAGKLAVIQTIGEYDEKETFSIDELNRYPRVDIDFCDVDTTGVQITVDNPHNGTVMHVNNMSEDVRNSHWETCYGRIYLVVIQPILCSDALAAQNINFTVWHRASPTFSLGYFHAPFGIAYDMPAGDVDILKFEPGHGDEGIYAGHWHTTGTALILRYSPISDHVAQALPECIPTPATDGEQKGKTRCWMVEFIHGEKDENKAKIDNFKKATKNSDPDDGNRFFHVFKHEGYVYVKVFTSSDNVDQFYTDIKNGKATITSGEKDTGSTNRPYAIIDPSYMKLVYYYPVIKEEKPEPEPSTALRWPPNRGLTEVISIDSPPGSRTNFHVRGEMADGEEKGAGCEALNVESGVALPDTVPVGSGDVTTDTVEKHLCQGFELKDIFRQYTEAFITTFKANIGRTADVQWTPRPFPKGTVQYNLVNCYKFYRGSINVRFDFSGIKNTVTMLVNWYPNIMSVQKIKYKDSLSRTNWQNTTVKYPYVTGTANSYTKVGNGFSQFIHISPMSPTASFSVPQMARTRYALIPGLHAGFKEHLVNEPPYGIFVLTGFSLDEDVRMHASIAAGDDFSVSHYAGIPWINAKTLAKDRGFYYSAVNSGLEREAEEVVGEMMTNAESKSVFETSSDCFTGFKKAVGVLETLSTVDVEQFTKAIEGLNNIVPAVNSGIDAVSSVAESVETIPKEIIETLQSVSSTPSETWYGKVKSVIVWLKDKFLGAFAQMGNAISRAFHYLVTALLYPEEGRWRSHFVEQVKVPFDFFSDYTASEIFVLLVMASTGRRRDTPFEFCMDYTRSGQPGKNPIPKRYAKWYEYIKDMNFDINRITTNKNAPMGFPSDVFESPLFDIRKEIIRNYCEHKELLMYEFVYSCYIARLGDSKETFQKYISWLNCFLAKTTQGEDKSFSTHLKDVVSNQVTAGIASTERGLDIDPLLKKMVDLQGARLGVKLMDAEPGDFIYDFDSKNYYFAGEVVDDEPVEAQMDPSAISPQVLSMATTILTQGTLMGACKATFCDMIRIGPSMLSFFTSIFNVIKGFFSMAPEMVFSEQESEMLKRYIGLTDHDKLKRWLEESSHYLSNSFYNGLYRDPVSINLFLEYYLLGYMFQHDAASPIVKCNDRALKAFFSSIFGKVKQRLDEIITEHGMTTAKYEPPCVHYCGESGMGKSFLVAETVRIAGDILKQHHTKPMCSLSAGQYDNWKGEFALIVDDFLQFGDKHPLHEKHIRTLFGVKSPVPYIGNFPDLESKGTEIAPSLLVLTSNATAFKSSMLADPKALNRRCDFRVLVNYSDEAEIYFAENNLSRVANKLPIDMTEVYHHLTFRICKDSKVDGTNTTGNTQSWSEPMDFETYTTKLKAFLNCYDTKERGNVLARVRQQIALLNRAPCKISFDDAIKRNANALKELTYHKDIILNASISQQMKDGQNFEAKAIKHLSSYKLANSLECQGYTHDEADAFRPKLGGGDGDEYFDPQPPVDDGEDVVAEGFPSFGLGSSFSIFTSLFQPPKSRKAKLVPYYSTDRTFSGCYKGKSAEIQTALSKKHSSNKVGAALLKALAALNTSEVAVDIQKQPHGFQMAFQYGSARIQQTYNLRDRNEGVFEYEANDVAGTMVDIGLASTDISESFTKTLTQRVVVEGEGLDREETQNILYQRFIGATMADSFSLTYTFKKSDPNKVRVDVTIGDDVVPLYLTRVGESTGLNALTKEDVDNSLSEFVGVPDVPYACTHGLLYSNSASFFKEGSVYRNLTGEKLCSMSKPCTGVDCLLNDKMMSLRLKKELKDFASMGEMPVVEAPTPVVSAAKKQSLIQQIVSQEDIDEIMKRIGESKPVASIYNKFKVGAIIFSSTVVALMFACLGISTVLWQGMGKIKSLITDPEPQATYGDRTESGRGQRVKHPVRQRVRIGRSLKAKPEMSSGVFNRIASNLIILRLIVDGNNYYSSQVLGVRDNFAVTTTHFLQTVVAASLAGADGYLEVCMNREVKQNITINLDSYTKRNGFDTYICEDTSLGLISFPRGEVSFKNICKHFISSSQMEEGIPSSDCTLITRKENGALVHNSNIHPRTAGIGTKESITLQEGKGPFAHPAETIPVEYVLTYNIHGPGMCISPLMANFNTGPKIASLHFGGQKAKGMGMGEMLSVDQLTNDLDQFCQTLSEITRTPVLDVGEITDAGDLIVDAEAETLIPECSNLIGVVRRENRVRSPKVTKLVEAPTFGDFFETTKEPAILSTEDKRADDVPEFQIHEPMEYANLKHDCVPFNIRTDIVDEVIRGRCEKVELVEPVRLDRHPIQPLEEVLNGVEGFETYSKLNLKTSEGYPWVKERPVGLFKVSSDGETYDVVGKSDKRWLFDTDEAGMVTGVDQKLLDRLESDDKKRSEGIAPLDIYLECAKDEKRPIEKVRTPGGTRKISVSPVHADISNKQKFGEFFAAYKKAGMFMGHVISLDEDAEATALVYFLTDNFKLANPSDKNFLVGDYKAFGDRISNHFRYGYRQVVEHWYYTWFRDHPDFEHSKKLREAMQLSNLMSGRLMGDALYTTWLGIQSGNSHTISENSECNQQMIKYMLIFIASALLSGLEGESEDPVLLSKLNELLQKYDKEKLRKILMQACTFRYWEKHSRIVVLGDDFLACLSSEAISFIDGLFQWAYEKHNIVITDPDKKNKIQAKNLYECDFLKRNFVHHPYRRGQWMMPLPRESCLEMLNWCWDKPGSEESVVYESARAVLNNMYSRGEAEYEEMRNQLRKWIFERFPHNSDFNAYTWRQRDCIVNDESSLRNFSYF